MLLSNACPTHRLEDALTGVALRFGMSAHVFCVPSGLWLSVAEPGQEPVLRIARVTRWSLDLDRLSAVARLCQELTTGEGDLEAAHRRLDVIEHGPPRYTAPVRMLAGACGSAAITLLFGGRGLEVALGALLGLLLTAMSTRIDRRTHTRNLSPFLHAVISATFAWAASQLAPELATAALIVAGVVLVVPGTSLTVALSELVNKNLVSGAGRLLEAVVVLLSLVFGVVAVAGLVRAGGGSLDFLNRAAGPPLPLYAQAFAMAAAGGAFAVLVSVPPRYLFAALVGSLIAGLSADLGIRYLQHPALGAFGGAFLASLYANALGRRHRQPAQLYLVPGIILLVPGTFGFFSFGKLFTGDIAAGASDVFQTLVVGAALATGIVAANALFPPREPL